VCVRARRACFFLSPPAVRHTFTKTVPALRRNSWRRRNKTQYRSEKRARKLSYTETTTVADGQIGWVG